MTPGARAMAAITILDRILGGEPAEKALTNWGRASRYAGSGDRAAIRDHVFDALRCRRSFAALGGGLTGRGLMLGALRAKGEEALFDGSPYAPARVTEADAGRQPTEAEALDVPDWLLPDLRASLGQKTEQVLQAMRTRAPVFLRVNTARASAAEAISALSAEGIIAEPHALAPTALEVTANARKIHNSAAYLSGLVELQDASSQAVVAALPLADGMRVLDLCAGGGGKTLAMAARARLTLYAYDSNPRRMADLPERAKRAGARIVLTEEPEKTAPYDLVLVDAPCSGSGSWRRDPEGKWSLTPARLDEISAIQPSILARAARMTAPKGWLAYATCSLLQRENDAQIAAFLAAHPGWRQVQSERYLPTMGGDGFYSAVLTRT
jgi:16S rRNA (cytosine967-C5)-methyltransferase